MLKPGKRKHSQLLGAEMKLSCARWNIGTKDPAEGGEEMLDLTCHRACLEDGKDEARRWLARWRSAGAFDEKPAGVPVRRRLLYFVSRSNILESGENQ